MGRRAEYTLLHGRLLDDIGAVISDHHVDVEMRSASGLLTQPRLTCGDWTETDTLRPDDLGHFCVAYRDLPAGHYDATLHARSNNPTSLYAPSDLSLPIEAGRGSVALRFADVPPFVRVGEPLALRVSATTDEGGPAANLSVGLSVDGHEIARRPTDASGDVEFRLAANEVGPPGPGEVVATYAGSPDLNRDVATLPIERRAIVRISLDPEDERELQKGVPTDGTTVRVRAGAPGFEVNGGEIELTADGKTIVAAPVTHGTARVPITFSAAGDHVALSFRYRPPSPWFDSTESIDLLAPVLPASAWRTVPFLAAVLLVAIFLFRGRRPQRFRTGASNEPAALPKRPAIPSVQMVRRHARGFSGRVIDVHDGFPISLARVWIERTRFASTEVIHSVVVDAEGRFSLPAPEIARECRLAAEGPYHRALRQALPEHGELEIALISRKRAIVEHLISWARKKGGPFDLRPEATPGHVLRQATTGSRIAVWAGKVERLAYDRGAVDALGEQDAEGLVPEAGALARPLREDLTLVDAVAPSFDQPAPTDDAAEKRDIDGTRKGFL